MQTLALYWELYKLAIKSRLEYRTDFAISLVATVVTQLAALAFFSVVFSSTPSVGGWSSVAVLLLIGMTAIVLGTSELFINGIWWLPGAIVNGEIDRVLLYPVPSLSFVLLTRPEVHAVGNVIIGATCVGWAWAHLTLPTAAALLLPLWLICGALIYTSGMVVMGSLFFRVVGSSSDHLFVVVHLLSASRYPLSIYPRWLQLALLWVLPLGVATFVPIEWLLGKTSLWPALVLPILAAALSSLAAITAWNHCLRYYESSGS